jgi:hypothetical protein
MALRTAMSSTITPSNRIGYDESMATVRAQIGDEAFAAGQADGLDMSLEQAMTFALSGNSARGRTAGAPSPRPASGAG